MNQLRAGACLLAVLIVGACDQVRLGPPPAVSESSEARTVTADVYDLRAHAGETYTEFSSQPGMERYSLAGFGASGEPAERFSHAMTRQAVGVLASGGGAEALVFSGCAPSGCLEGLSVVAIDVATGEVFAGVSDMSGKAELAQNARLEALLRLTSPTRSWDDPVRPSQPITDAP